MCNEVVGVDISEKAINEAKKVLDNALILDVQEDNLPFPENYFDIIILTETLEHLFLPEKAIEQSKRVLKNDGFIIVTTPNFLVLSNRIKMLFGHFKYTDSGFLDKGHIHFFTYKELLSFLNQEGLKIVMENHLVCFRFPEFFIRVSPSLFAFQFVVKAQKLL